jgi:hypothetical protein
VVRGAVPSGRLVAAAAVPSLIGEWAGTLLIMGVLAIWDCAGYRRRPARGRFSGTHRRTAGSSTSSRWARSLLTWKSSGGRARRASPIAPAQHIFVWPSGGGSGLAGPGRGGDPAAFNAALLEQIFPSVWRLVDGLIGGFASRTLSSTVGVPQEPLRCRAGP